MTHWQQCLKQFDGKSCLICFYLMFVHISPNCQELFWFIWPQWFKYSALFADLQGSLNLKSLNDPQRSDVYAPFHNAYVLTRCTEVEPGHKSSIGGGEICGCKTVKKIFGNTSTTLKRKTNPTMIRWLKVQQLFETIFGNSPPPEQWRRATSGSN